jgi:hypothetical protein
MLLQLRASTGSHQNGAAHSAVWGAARASGRSILQACVRGLKDAEHVGHKAIDHQGYQARQECQDIAWASDMSGMPSHVGVAGVAGTVADVVGVDADAVRDVEGAGVDVAVGAAEDISAARGTDE